MICNGASTRIHKIPPRFGRDYIYKAKIVQIILTKSIFNQNYTIYNVEYQHSLSAILNVAER